MYDIHSHVLPAIDDGAKSLDESVELCRIAAGEGVRAIVATPHIREGVWPNRRNRIAERVDDLRQELKRQEVAIDLVLGAELYFASDIVAAVAEGAFPTYGEGRRYLLLELPNHFILRQVQQLVFELRTAGVSPVLAHPERNPQLCDNLEAMDELVRMGMLVQVTAMSVTGKFGRQARKSAERMIDRGLVHAVASDGHHARFRPTRMREAYDAVAARSGAAVAERLMVENPGRIIAGEEVDLSPGFGAEPPRRGLGALLGRLLGSA